ncbi:hypothetical protein RR48_12695 [Papilio machaon]|uniref:Uncharacterized protein n=1 Tax=Papilio machaon TaxID=76193 RepID=A0A194QQS1_PAPMA|nr:hypothetical protein RR48_12695 [Papilio machaon]
MSPDEHKVGIDIADQRAMWAHDPIPRVTAGNASMKQKIPLNIRRCKDDFPSKPECEHAESGKGSCARTRHGCRRTPDLPIHIDILTELHQSTPTAAGECIGCTSGTAWAEYEVRTWTSLPAEAPDEHLPATQTSPLDTEVHSQRGRLGGQTYPGSLGTSAGLWVTSWLWVSMGSSAGGVGRAFGRTTTTSERRRGGDGSRSRSAALPTTGTRLPRWAHPSTQRRPPPRALLAAARAAPLTARTAPRRIDSFTTYTIIHTLGTMDARSGALGTTT